MEFIYYEICARCRNEQGIEDATAAVYVDVDVDAVQFDISNIFCCNCLRGFFLMFNMHFNTMSNLKYVSDIILNASLPLYA